MKSAATDRGNRRGFLRSSVLGLGALGLGDLFDVCCAATERGTVHVVVFSNFEGLPQDPAPAIRWFEECSNAHSAIRWTHMYNPRYLVLKSPDMATTEAGFSRYLLDLLQRGTAEVGLHMHMFYDLVREAGVEPRAFPFAGDKAAGCDTRRRVEDDPNGGYDVLMTGYAPREQAAILDLGISALVDRGFGRPTSFCAGYSAADSALQGLLAEKGFQVSFAAQVIPPEHYGSCWDRLLGWSGQITPLTIPYRESRASILPPPHKTSEYLDLVEVPLNMGVDASDLYLDKKVAQRSEMFDRHCEWAARTRSETAVAIGVHAEVVGRETWGKGPVSETVDGFLKHVERRASEGSVAVRYGTVSETAKRFHANTTLGQVPRISLP